MTQQTTDKIGLRETVSIGIGGMVGGGIFAILGLVVALAKGGTPISFIIAGLIALITTYSYVKLSLRYPSRGGTVKFINQSFGKGIFSGSINNLLWLSYLILISLYATAFAAYAPNLLTVTGDANVDKHLFATGLIVIATAINYYSTAVVGKIESLAVLSNLSILLLFVAIGGYGLLHSPYISQLQPTHWQPPVELLTAGMVIFVAYEGFELIANAAPDVKNPQKTLPKAYFGAVIFVILLYVAIAVITVGSLSFAHIQTAQDYVLAAAAKPMLGQLGFTVITVAALIATFSAVNASLYGSTRVNENIAENDELPHEFTAQLWHHPVGLLITAILTIILVNTLNLSSISTAGSVGFLLIFAIVNLAGYRLRKTTHSNAVIPLIGFAACIVALAALIIQRYPSSPVDVYIAVGIIAFCFVAEWIYKLSEKNHRRKPQ